MPEANDAELVRRAQGGDVNAIGELYDRHHEPIFRYVRSRIYNHHAAEDLTGEIFARMVTSLPDYRSRGVPFRAWLYRIAHNLVVDHHRKAGKRDLVPLAHAEALSGGGHNPGTVVERQLALEQVQKALEKLNETQREVVVLRFLVGLSLREVAQTLDKTVAAVKSTQHRGLKALRLTLQQA